tara:strand:+ start:1167 stop:1325 length:159 start_codon:yes stop_codon:yes gene_type:complete
MYSLVIETAGFTMVILALLVVFIGVSLGYYILTGILKKVKQFINYCNGVKNK